MDSGEPFYRGSKSVGLCAIVSVPLDMLAVWLLFAARERAGAAADVNR